MNRFKGMSAGAMIKYLEEQKQADDLLLQKIKTQDKCSSKNNTGGGKGGNRGNGKDQGTIKPKESPPTRVHPPYTDKVTWICPKCLWGNWHLEDPNCFNRKCRAPQPNYAGGAAAESSISDKTDNRDRESEKKLARMKTVLGPMGGAKGQQILEGAGIAAVSLQTYANAQQDQDAMSIDGQDAETPPAEESTPKQKREDA